MTMTSYALRGTELWNGKNGENDQELLQRMGDTYNQTATINQAYWTVASIDERFYAGDQSLWNEIYSNIPTHRRKQFNFNKIRRIVNMISGHQRRNRKSIACIPIEGSDQQTADQFSKLLIWANNQCNTLETISDAFQGALVSGLNLLSVWMDYRDDPINGDLKIDNLGYNGFIIDPYWTKLDLSDCNYLWIRKFLSRKQLCSMFPEHEDEIEKMQADTHKDGRFQFLPQNYNFAYKDLLAYDEYWYLDYRDATIIIDKESGETLEYEGDKENLKYWLMLNPKFKKGKIKKASWKLGISVNGGRVLYHGKNPYKIDRMPFVPVVAYHQPELPYFEWRFQGVVRSLRDSQFLANRRTQILLDVLESQINSGLKVMEGSLVDNNDAFKSGQGQVLFIKKDAAMGMDSVQKIPSADVSPAMFSAIEMMDKNMMEISGVNEELLGSAEDDKAGILGVLRQNAGLTTLQILFDKLDQSLEQVGVIEMDMISKNFKAGKVRRVINEEPTQQFFQGAFQKYDCAVVEGVYTPTQRMMAFKQALYLKEMGVPITTKFLLEMSTLQNKTELLKDIEAQEKQQAQMAQQQQQLQMYELQAKANLANARAEADKGTAIERISRVAENEGLAIERRAQAVLDEVKAAKELQGLDIAQLRGLVEILEKIKGIQSQEEPRLESKGQQQTMAQGAGV